MNLTNGATIGVAGSNTRQLIDTVVGIAGNLGTTLRPHVAEVVSSRAKALPGRQTLGDRAAARGFDRACWLLDYTYVSCPDRLRGGMRWGKGFEQYFAPGVRRLPLIFDSAAFREFTGSAPSWSSYTRYVQAIDVVRPDRVMAKDVIGNQPASLENYQRMVSDGYGDITIPVWTMRPTYDVTLSPAQNGALAAFDPTLRWYVDHAPMVAIGGMVKGPCLRDGRADYLGALVDAFPDSRFWGLGQASGVVINGLARLGLLDKVSTDGSWWIHSAATEQIAVVRDGWLTNLNLARTNTRSFFTMVELMGANLRSLLSAYQGVLAFPGPAVVPTNMEDVDERNELKRRVQQLDLFDSLALA